MIPDQRHTSVRLSHPAMRLPSLNASQFVMAAAWASSAWANRSPAQGAGGCQCVCLGHSAKHAQWLPNRDAVAVPPSGGSGGGS